MTTQTHDAFSHTSDGLTLAVSYPANGDTRSTLHDAAGKLLYDGAWTSRLTPDQVAGESQGLDVGAWLYGLSVGAIPPGCGWQEADSEDDYLPYLEISGEEVKSVARILESALASETYSSDLNAEVAESDRPLLLLMDKSWRVASYVDDDLRAAFRQRDETRFLVNDPDGALPCSGFTLRPWIQDAQRLLVKAEREQVPGVDVARAAVTRLSTALSACMRHSGKVWIEMVEPDIDAEYQTPYVAARVPVSGRSRPQKNL